MMKKFFMISVFLLFTTGFGNAKIIVDKDCSYLGEKGYFDFNNQKCSCKDGYIYTKNTLGTRVCQEPNEYCIQKFGKSHYDSEQKQCSCDEGYTRSSSENKCKKQEFIDINYSKYDNIPAFLMFNIKDDYQVSYNVDMDGDSLACKNTAQTLVFNIQKNSDKKITGLKVDCINVDNKADVDFSEIQGTKLFAGQKFYISAPVLSVDSFFVVNGDDWYYIDEGVSFVNSGTSSQQISMNIGASFVDENGDTVYIDPQDSVNLSIYPYYGDGYFGMQPLTSELNMIFDEDDPMYTNQYYIGKQNIDKVWSKYSDLKSITVAVIDEGVGFVDNDDIKDVVWTNSGEIPDNGKDDDGNGYIDDYYGRNFVKGNNNMIPYGNHGTNVAGILAAQHSNNYGIRGVATNVKIMPLIACDKEQCPPQSIVDSMKYAIDNGAKILNISLGGNEFSYDSVFDNMVKYAKSKGVILVVSAGNGSFATQLGFESKGLDTSKFKVSPACNDIDNPYDVIGVGALDINGNISKWSNYGKCVDFWSYGEKIFTNELYGYTSFSQEAGTSFSAPQVSGIIALGLGINPNLTSKEIYQILQKNVNDNILDALGFVDYIYDNYKDFTPESGLSTSSIKPETKEQKISSNTVLLDSRYKKLVDDKMDKFFKKINDIEDSQRTMKLGYIMGKLDEKISSSNSSDVQKILKYMKDEINSKYFDE